MSWPPMPPWLEVVDAFWRIALPAGGLAFAVPLAARFAFGRSSLTLATPLGAIAGLALAFGLRQPVPWQPEDFGSAWTHIAWAIALAGGGIAASLSARWNWLPKLAAVAAAVWILLPDDRREGPWWFIALAAAMAIPWLAMPTADNAATRRQWPERSVWLTIALAAMSVVALYSHYLRITDFAMMAAFATAGAGTACLLLGRDGREPEGLAYVTLPALAFFCWNDVESAIPAAGFVCIGLAALPMAGFQWWPEGGRRAKLLRGLVVLVPVAIAVVLAIANEDASFG